MTLFGELVPSVPPESTQQVVGYPSLFLLVVLGSLVPVVPTGALVSSAAVVAFHHTSPFALLMVFVVASSAAFLGDVGLYSLGRRGSHSPTVRAGWHGCAPARRRSAWTGRSTSCGTRGPGTGAVPVGAGRADPGHAGVSARGDATAAVRPW